ncbi:30S ribosomal protein S2 [Candidatus Pacearchaeota archaeon]|nr:30S ribosomal protein S2 [Candidatus Pacearchaeota archaeon]
MTDTKETLVPLTDYIACSVHLGTKVITPDMRKYVYKRRADGLAVINTNLIDDKIRDASAFFNQYAPEDVFIVSKREASWPAVEKFSEVTGIRAFMKKYPAGIITNLILDNFFEAKLVIICDPWVDKNALNDALRLKIPTLAICDTNNYARLITKVVPSNNKSRKSVGLILYILAREYLKSLGKEKEAKELKLEDFAGKIEQANEDADAEAKKQETDFRKPRDTKTTRARYGV